MCDLKKQHQQNAKLREACWKQREALNLQRNALQRQKDQINVEYIENLSILFSSEMGLARKVLKLPEKVTI